MKEFYKTLVNPKGRFGFWGIGAIVLLGALLMVLPEFFDRGERLGQSPAAVTLKETTDSTGSLNQMEQFIARQVGSFLSQVEGAGEVVVSLTLEHSPEKEYAENTTEDQSTVEERDTNGGVRVSTDLNHRSEVVFAQSKNEPVVKKEIGARIKGIVVIAEGAKDSSVKERLTRAVRAMLDVPAHRVLVLPKESR